MQLSLLLSGIALRGIEVSARAPTKTTTTLATPTPDCEQLQNHCTNSGYPFGGGQWFLCLEPMLKNQTQVPDSNELLPYPANRILVVACGNSKFQEDVANGLQTKLTPSCQKILDTCNAARLSSKYWSWNTCLPEVKLGHRKIHYTEILYPAFKQTVLEACRVEMPTPEITGPCNQIAIKCREDGYVEDRGLYFKCTKPLVDGYSVIPDTNIPLTVVDQALLESCRATMDIQPCDRVDIICRQNGIDQYANCHLPIMQGLKLHPTTNAVLPVVNATFKKQCNDFKLSKAFSIEMGIYEYNTNFSIVNLQNVTKAQANDLDWANYFAGGSVEREETMTAQQLYDLEVSENLVWRALSANFTTELDAGKININSSSIPVTTRKANLNSLSTQLYNIWLQIFKLAYTKRHRQHVLLRGYNGRHVEFYDEYYQIIGYNDVQKYALNHPEARDLILGRRIKRITRELGLLKILETIANDTEKIAVSDYYAVLSNDLNSLTQFKANFNETYWSTCPNAIIREKVTPIEALVRQWEYEMFMLLAKKNQIVNAVSNLAYLL